jgi:hypothetical protein
MLITPPKLGKETMGIIPDQPVTTGEMVLSNVIFDEALVQGVLVRKGLVTEQEIIDEIESPVRLFLFSSFLLLLFFAIAGTVSLPHAASTKRT